MNLKYVDSSSQLNLLDLLHSRLISISQFGVIAFKAVHFWIIIQSGNQRPDLKMGFKGFPGGLSSGVSRPVSPDPDWKHHDDGVRAAALRMPGFRSSPPMCAELHSEANKLKFQTPGCAVAKHRWLKAIFMGFESIMQQQNSLSTCVKPAPALWRALRLSAEIPTELGDLQTEFKATFIFFQT